MMLYTVVIFSGELTAARYVLVVGLIKMHRSDAAKKFTIHLIGIMHTFS